MGKLSDWLSPKDVKPEAREDYQKFKYQRFNRVAIAGCVVAAMISMAYTVIDMFAFHRWSAMSVTVRIFPLLLCAVFLFFFMLRKRDDSYLGLTLCSDAVYFSIFAGICIYHSTFGFAGSVTQGLMLLQCGFFLLAFATPLLYSMTSLWLYLVASTIYFLCLPLEGNGINALLSLMFGCGLCALCAWLDRAMAHTYNLERQIEELMLHDPLTGAYNRNRIDQMDLKTDQDVLLMLDVDMFKQINDTYGHDKGDQVLQSIANCISRCIREQDTLIRYGGEEFLVVLDHLNLVDGMASAERIRKSIEKADHYGCHVTASLGVCRCSKDNFQISVKNADQALYVAKKSGRNRVECYES